MIDWDKPLECEHGAVVKERKLFSKYMEVSCENSTWVVDDETGIALDKWMPIVYNAKRKPKDREWWYCRDARDSVAGGRPLYFFKGKFRSSGIDLAGQDNVKPLYPLIKDPSYKE